MEEVKHYQVNGRYRVVFERAASTKGVLGFKVEANGDSVHETFEDAKLLKERAELYTLPSNVLKAQEQQPQP